MTAVASPAASGTTASERPAVGGSRPRTNQSGSSSGARMIRPAVGIAIAIAIWWLLTDVVFAARPLVSQFSPGWAVTGLRELAVSGTLIDAASSSVYRLLAGLLIAAILGVGFGVALGSLPWFEQATGPLQAFLRMVSPLSWAPVSIIAFGIGDPPVISLVAAAAVWPILSATADAVRRVDPRHRRVARALGATRLEVLRSVVLPSIQPGVLVGLRQALGVAWVVLVPAEMLGVTSGLGYQVLNAKDQLAYHHITALILVIGLIGYAIDTLARWALATRRQRRSR